MNPIPRTSLASPVVRAASVAALLSVLASPASAAVTLTVSAAAPSIGAEDQSSLIGGATANPAQDFGDNPGAPGQSFTTPTGDLAGYTLDSVSFRAVAANSTNISFNAGSVWGVQIARFDNAASGGFGSRTDDNGTPYSAAYTDSAFVQASYTSVTLDTGYDLADGDAWVTFRFTGADRVTLDPGSTYSFQIFNPTGGYVNFDRSVSDTYVGGIGFTPYGGAFQFNDNYVQFAGNDRVFIAGLTGVSAIPEPSAFAALAGLVGVACALGRRRRAR